MDCYDATVLDWTPWVDLNKKVTTEVNVGMWGVGVWWALRKEVVGRDRDKV